MIYDSIMQETLDINWFMTDKDGYIAHFGSGGCLLPPSVATSIEDNETVQEFFKLWNNLSDSIINGNNPKLKTIQDSNRDWYFSSFVVMAQKGFYSFDTEILGDPLNTSYVKVASPTNPLHIKMLPVNIADILFRTRTDVLSFSSVDSLDWVKNL